MQHRSNFEPSRSKFNLKPDFKTTWWSLLTSQISTGEMDKEIPTLDKGEPPVEKKNDRFF